MSVLAVFRDDGYVKFLTKGDGNQVDDRGFYLPGQLWLERKDMIGKVKGYVNYLLFSRLDFVFVLNI